MINCNIIYDLLPLYIDNVCSEESRELVEEHIKTCEKCKLLLDNMQSGADFRINREESLQRSDTLKAIKRKFFRKNVLVALVSVAASLAILLGVWYYIFAYETLIPYEDGLASVEVHQTITAIDSDGATIIITEPLSTEIEFVMKDVLDVKSSKNTSTVRSTSRYIEEDDRRIHLTYVNFSETHATKWQDNNGSSEHFIRIVEPQTDDEPVDHHEVYYLNTSIDTAAESFDSVEYAKFRENGTLIWSGNLD